jgi:hypothetical protein
MVEILSHFTPDTKTKKRITYEELAKHSFIDLEHIPSSSSLQKAVSYI